MVPVVVVDAVKFNVAPTLPQSGLLLPPVGVTGVWLISTATVPGADVQLLTVTVTL